MKLNRFGLCVLLWVVSCSVHIGVSVLIGGEPFPWAVYVGILLLVFGVTEPRIYWRTRQ